MLVLLVVGVRSQRGLCDPKIQANSLLTHQIKDSWRLCLVLLVPSG
jgi:hypothetical protein